MPSYSHDPVASIFAVESLLKDARDRSEATDAERPVFIEALEILAHSLDTEAQLTSAGRIAVRNALIGSLQTQIQLHRNLLEHTEIEQQPISQPVFIIGMLRTGSTLIHNLLSQHPDLRVPKLWELQYPAELARTPSTQEALADKAQAYVDEYFQVAPQLKNIHFLNARQPDECHRLLGTTFQSMVYTMRYRIPTYANWLSQQNLTQAYTYHLLQMKNILWRIPGKVVVLKCPFHAWYLDALVQTYPTAKFIHLHRDPTVAVLSTCSLCAAIRVGRSAAVEKKEIGQQWLSQIELGIERMQEGRNTILKTKPVMDILYDDVMKDTLGTMRQVCDFIEVPMTEDAEMCMRHYLENNHQNKYGSHRYTAEEFGLNRDDLDRRFPAYRSQYKLFPAQKH